MSARAPLATDALKRDQYGQSGKLLDRANVHARFSTNPQGFPRWIFEQLELRSGERVLDLGCGPGMLWSRNRERLPEDLAFTLSDFSKGMLEDARRELAECPPAFEFCVCDAQSIPFDTGSFDLVIANHMLYHVPDRPRALAEIARVLVPTGRLVASTPGEGNMARIGELLAEAGVDGAYWGSKTSAAFTIENGRAQLERVFEAIRVERYRDSLSVTEAEPLVRYVQSLPRPEPLNDSQASDFRQLLEDLIRGEGSVDVPKSGGLFLAKPRS